MKVCVLAQECPCSWVEHYVAAFRAAHDTLVLGPRPDGAALQSWDRHKAAHLIQPNDIVCDFPDGTALESLLPEGWTPDLVVGIAGIGGAPLYPRVAELPWPSAFITVDTWQCLLDYREAVQYDMVFAAQREFVEPLRATGSRHVFWLPLACAPEAHFPTETAPTHDIAFAGSATMPVHRARRRLLEGLAQRFSVIAQEQVFGPDLCAFFAQGRLAFNQAAVQELNMRIFEALAMGRPLLTNADSAGNGLLDLFVDGKHLIVYDGEADLYEKAAAYLADPERREAMARAGRDEVLARHTYTHRVATIVDTFQNLCRDVADEDVSPHFRGWSPHLPGRTVHLEAAHGPTLPPGEADTVLAVCEAGGPQAIEQCLGEMNRLLCPGGTAVLRVSLDMLAVQGLKPDASLLGPWLVPHGFRPRRVTSLPESTACLLELRKRTRSLREVVAEVLTRLQVPELDIDELLNRIPECY